MVFSIAQVSRSPERLLTASVRHFTLWSISDFYSNHWMYTVRKVILFKIPALVGGANGGSEIVKMWKDYFKGILNSENSANGSAESVEHSIDCRENYLRLEMTTCSVVLLTSLLQTQPLSKALGPDCVSAEHLHAGESLCFLFSELFNMCIVHRYVLNSCLNTKIVPISKNKNGNISDTSNYRPVAVATVVSKLLEHYISSCISSFLGTTDNQFGFKSGQWT